jgi:hypothetical protein
MLKKINLKNTSIPNFIAILFCISGGFFALYYLITDTPPYVNISTSYFLDTITIPFDWVKIGPISFPIKVDNYIVFQEYKSIPTELKITQSLVFGLIIILSAGTVLTILTAFKKVYFILGGIVWILLLTFSNLNGLNINGLNTNYPLIILLGGSIIPLILLHIWGQNLSLLFRWLLINSSLALSLYALIHLSTVVRPEIYLAEHSMILGLGLSMAWIFWNGHSVLSGTYIVMARVNQNLNLKISIQFALITIVYIATLIFILLALTGEQDLPFPVFSPFYLLIPMGIFGWIAIKEKTNQTDQLVASSNLIHLLHLLGLGIAFWLVWKLKISGNQPAEEFMKHLLVYSQMGFSIFFSVYVFANFLSIMDSGKSVDKILFKPHSLVYYHIRIGGLIAMLVITTFAGGILGIQVNSMTTNIVADYYYQTQQKLEASIFYQSAWSRYRKNAKAKNTLIHLLYELNQPTLAKQHLEESFAEVPQVDNILLLADRLHRENKIFEAVYYLERGLELYPGKVELVNNLSLLYVKMNKGDKALALLNSSSSTDQILLSNQIALTTKLGNPQQPTFPINGIIGEINQLAASNYLGNIPEQSLLKSLKNQVSSEDSPMLLNAALRNSLSEINLDDPTADLNMLDSLADSRAMQSYSMNLQETEVIRSLAAGRVAEALKNLNGLAFRNPDNAGYYLQLSASIFTKNLDFQKAAIDLIAAEEKGFQAFDTHHWTIFGLAGMPEKAAEIREVYKVELPDYTKTADEEIRSYLQIISTFISKTPQSLWVEWRSFPENALKTDMAIRLISTKAHGLESKNIKELAEYISSRIGENEELSEFATSPDLSDSTAIKHLANWIKASENLSANPYLTPLIISEMMRENDELIQYELLNSASEFNPDPILWWRKIEKARQIGLDSYADDAQATLLRRISKTEVDKLNMSNN